MNTDQRREAAITGAQATIPNPAPVPEVAPADMRTPQLVSEFATLKVWFAVHEVTGRHPQGGVKHRHLRAVVTELRNRGVLD